MKAKRKSLIVIAMVLLLALVIGMSSMTFAKYVSSTDKYGADATVAKWGFVLNVNAENLFGNNYGAATDNLATATTATGVNVASNAVVVAPGTTGSINFSITGQAEVPAKLVIDANTDKDVYLTKGSETYYPIVWTLKKGDAVEATGTLAEVMAAVAGNDTIAIGTTLNDTYTLSWAWAFENADSGITDLSADAADTILGQAANGTAFPADYTGNTALQLNLSISIEQTQIAA